MFAIPGMLQAVFSFLGGIAPAISGYFQAKANVEDSEFTQMTTSDQAEAIALIHAQTELNNAKITNNSHGAAQVMIYLFGLPVAIHWNAVWIATTFPSLGLVIKAAPPSFQDAELKVVLSFFLLAPALPIFSSLAARLRG